MEGGAAASASCPSPTAGSGAGVPTTLVIRNDSAQSVYVCAPNLPDGVELPKHLGWGTNDPPAEASGFSSGACHGRPPMGSYPLLGPIEVIVMAPGTSASVSFAGWDGKTCATLPQADGGPRLCEIDLLPYDEASRRAYFVMITSGNVGGFLTVLPDDCVLPLPAADSTYVKTCSRCGGSSQTGGYDFPVPGDGDGTVSIVL